MQDGFLPELTFAGIRQLMVKEQERIDKILKDECEVELKRLYDQIVEAVKQGETFVEYSSYDNINLKTHPVIMNELMKRFPERVYVWKSNGVYEKLCDKDIPNVPVQNIKINFA